jgi:hypothetical protein
MKAKELYRALETELGGWLVASGFKKRRGSRLVFQRVVGGKYHSVWFQCDKYGWDSYAGGKFYVNFTVSESPDVEGRARRDERLNYFLTDAELESARDYQDKVIEGIPKPPESYFETLQTQWSKHAESATELVETVRNYFEPTPFPYQRHQDFALRYWQRSDVIGWAALIASVLPRAVGEMETWSLPQPR